MAAATRGASIAEISASLFLSEGTVRNYLSVAMQKLGAHNRVEVANIAEQKGWL
ncbi:MAG TPA: LuxR C-terminal-related transcriptional regulator [Ktedonobacteraceae bacterium]|nr:LuxR C-terminal-related transcriptional regulator [Ktedonobacteraceae bacterium]